MPKPEALCIKHGVIQDLSHQQHVYSWPQFGVYSSSSEGSPREGSQGWELQHGPIEDHFRVGVSMEG